MSENENNVMASASDSSVSNKGTNSNKGTKNRREQLLPIFIRDIIRDNTSKEHPCNQEFIRNTLEKTYSIEVNKSTVRRTLVSLLDEDLYIFLDGRNSYYYDRLGYYRH